MMWKKALLAVAIIIAVTLGIIAVKPAQISQLTEQTDLKFLETEEIPLTAPFPVNSFAVSGSWEGPGYAEVWLISDNQEYLVMDTRSLPRIIEFSLGTSFEAVCAETCDLPSVRLERLVAYISGPGVLSIDFFHMSTPMSPSGLAACPNCKTVQQPDTPDHSMLMLVLLLAIAIVGSHVFSHFCTNCHSKRVLLAVFVMTFIVLGGLFGISIAAPTTAIAVTAKKAASILAAVGVLALCAIIAVEMHIGKAEPPKPNVWKDLEDAEEEWEKK